MENPAPMAFAKALATLTRIAGYLAAWAIMTLAITLAARNFHIGPGFANPLPYAAFAMLVSQTGRLLRKWVQG